MTDQQNQARGTHDQTTEYKALQQLKRRRDQLITELKNSAYGRSTQPNRKVRRRDNFDALLAKFEDIERKIKHLQRPVSQ